MQIDMTGHQIEVTPALRSFTEEKLSRLNRHNEWIQSIHVTFSKEHVAQVAEATIHVKGSQIHAKSQSNEDMYAAVDVLIDKLDAQLRKHKERMTEHRD